MSDFGTPVIVPVTVPVVPKPAARSRTMLVNVGVLVLSITIFVLTAIQTGQLHLAWNNPEVVAMALAIANIILRSLTTQPIQGVM
jgi:hypothetical protein